MKAYLTRCICPGQKECGVRITHVECYLVKVPGPSPAFAWRDGLPGSWPDGDGAVLRICTDEGNEGVAFAPRKGLIVQNIVDRLLREELIGADPLQREWLWHRTWELDRVEEMPLYVLGLVDVALWDLAAKSAGLPVWKLLGGYRTEIPAQASTVTFRFGRGVPGRRRSDHRTGLHLHQAARLGRLAPRRQAVRRPARARG